MTDNSDPAKDGNRHCSLRLFVAGNAPNSRIAKENLRRFCEGTPEWNFEVEVVDVMEDPQAALTQGVFVTPALQVIEPGPGTLLFGNLSDTKALQSLFP